MMIKNEGGPQFDGGPMMPKNDQMAGNPAGFDVGNNMMLKTDPLPNFDGPNVGSMQQQQPGGMGNAGNLPMNSMNNPLSNVIKQVSHH